MLKSAPIRHGRRQGQTLTKDTKTISFEGLESTPKSASVGLNQVAVLTKSDWDRIQSQLNRRQIEEEKIRRERDDRQKLHELSLEKVKTWTNTVYGQRNKKLEARRLREEQEEEERKKIDLEEAIYQAKQRKEAIEKAKTQQYYQTDRVKNFHSALLLTEVMKERDAQIELKQLKERLNGEKDRETLEQLRRDADDERHSEFEKSQAQREKNLEQEAYLRAQINRNKNEVERLKADDDKEGEELRRLAALYAEERRQLDEERKHEAKRQMTNNLQQIEDIKYMKQIDKMREEDDDEQCRMFAAAKRKMMKMRAEKEREIYEEKQATLEAIKQQLMDQMHSDEVEENDRMERAIQEQDEHKMKMEEAKKEKDRKMRESINNHRLESLRKLEFEKADEKRKAIESLQARLEADALFARNEMEKAGRRRNNAKEVESLQLKQAADRKLLEQLLNEQALDQERMNRQLLDVEESQFQEYAKHVIDKAERGGRNTYALNRAAQIGAGGGRGNVYPDRGSIRPSYQEDGNGAELPNYQRGSTDEVKRNISCDGVTGQRLGFVW